MEPIDKAVESVEKCSRAATLLLAVCILFSLLLIGMGFYGSYIAGRIRGIHEGYEYGQAACN